MHKMETIQFNRFDYRQRYASRGIIVSPNPPQVGIPTTIELQLQNPGPEALTISRIETKVAQFGMGVAWEHLPQLGPFHLPANPAHVEKIAQRWTPQIGGHRCVRASIFSAQFPQPLCVGCNLHVIEAEAEMVRWQVPFRLGNPERERKPVVLRLEQNHPHEVLATIMVKKRIMRAGEPIWLAAGEEVDAILLLRAHTRAAIESINNIEASIDGHLLDGIQVIVQRPARLQHPIYPAIQPAHADAPLDALVTLQR
jgi:hypothetical protein